MKMKKVLINLVSLFTILLMVNCQEDEKSFGTLTKPTNLEVNFEIVGKDGTHPNGDGSGMVKITATAANAVSYTYVVDSETPVARPSGVFNEPLTEPGLHHYVITVVANGKGGVNTDTTIELDVLYDYKDPETVQFLTGGTQKNWYFSASEPGHLGVGQNDSDETKNYYANYYMAAPFEKAGSPNSSCLYDNILTFSLDGNQLKYQLNNQGRTFFNTAFQSVVGGTAGSDNCYDYDTSGIKNVSLGASESVVSQNPLHESQTTGTVLRFSDNGFMGYYIGQNSYEVLSITENRMVVRAVMGGNDALAWYHIFTTTPPNQVPETDYTNLIWSDEFNTDGAPDPTKWGYDLGNGVDGWGNQEVQSYSNSANNVAVADGNLKITLRAQGSGYTSGRIKTQGKFQFTYGKVEARAKLPTGGGTWPAIWMLGAVNTNAWPACGEIDIMEHKGNQPNVIYGTLHYPGRSAGNANSNSTTIANASTDFHIYKTVWSPTSIKIYVDDVLFHSVANSTAIPFNHDFFLIMNVAMGGYFGGTVAPGFTQSSMEVDYVRVYQ